MVQAFSGLADRAEQIDTDRLADSIDTLADLTKDTPAAFQSTLRGLSRLSETVASRNDQIGELLRNLDTVSGVLADRDQDIVTLMKNSDILLRALVARRDAVHTLLVSTSRFSTELTLLVKQSRADLKPALEQPPGRGQPAAEEPEQPRREPAADGALLPGLRQHSRAAVRGSTPGSPTFLRSPPAGWSTDEDLQQDQPADRRSSRWRRSSPRCSSSSGPARDKKYVVRRLPAHRLPLRGLGRQDPRRRGRQGRQGRLPPAPRSRSSSTTTASTRCRPTPRPPSSRPSIVGDRFVQLTPAYNGRRRDGEQRHPRHRPHGDARWSSTRSSAASTTSTSRSVRTAPTRPTAVASAR